MEQAKDALTDATAAFFKLYWKIENGATPQWSDHWFFKGEIPNHDKRGCYALFNGDDIIYIGVGVGRSSITYDGHGLGDRLKRYWRVNKETPIRTYRPSEDWKEVTSIMTIGFDQDHYYLAAALEIYLIKKLHPARNTKQIPRK